MSLPKQIAFSFLPLFLLALVLEGGLWLAGFEAPIDRADPYVGFAGEIPLFEDELDAETGVLWRRTAPNKLSFFNDQRFLADKPEGSRRVFCLGGSTTYGRPYDDATSFCRWLRESLAIVAPDTTWEVVNAGGISYASYRVTALMRQLVREEPDLFVVYTGHNEFLEERTYAGMRDRSALRRHVELAASHSRVYGLLDTTARRFQVERGARAPSGPARDQLAAEVHTRLESSVGLDAYHRDDALRSAVVEHFRLNLDRMVDIARNAGAELVLVVPADNLSDCSPFKSEPDPELDEATARSLRTRLSAAEQALHRGALASARAGFEAVLERDPRHAHARYGLGRVLRALGEPDAAHEAFVAARDQDVCPLRALTEVAAIVRETGREQGVPTVDFPAVLREASGAGTPHAPGAEWFLDHVHPTIDGHRLLARHLMRAVHALGWLPQDPETLRAAIDAHETQVVASLDARAHGRALKNLAKVLSWAGKTEDAARAATQALEALGDDAESYFVLAEWASRRGDPEQAVAYLRRSVGIDPRWAKARNNLGVELMRLGLEEDALEAYDEALRLDPEHASARFNRGNCLRALGRYADAARDFERTLAVDPDDLDAWFNLAGVYESMGRREDAQRSLERLLALDPEDAEAAERLARLARETRAS
ncbi:MAG: tetratricopeptide repeat protein [Spirochaetaceae bacterium]|nr:tetratricopeptide repeat protein [Spirochaetaceae bacterium]